MWAVNNQTRFKADRAFARDQDGAEIWIVAVRGTFDLQADSSVTVSEVQEDVCLAPKYFGEPGKSSLRYEMDLVRTKPGTDILVHAHAHSPHGRPVPFVDVQLQVADISKVLRIHGDRVWERASSGLVPGPAEPFVSKSIRYEQSLGGPLGPGPDAPCDPMNRVGVGRNAGEGLPVPNIEYLNAPIRSPKHKGPPAGFGPIPCDWQQRVQLAGTYDAVWQNERQPLVPKDFQDSYFRCAPTDQHIKGFLQGGEEVVLHNLTTEGILRFQLPRVSLGFRTRIDGGTTHHRGQLHTVFIEPEEHRLIMVWHTSLPCHHTLYTLKETTVFEKERVPLGGESREDAEPVVA